MRQTMTKQSTGAMAAFRMLESRPVRIEQLTLFDTPTIHYRGVCQHGKLLAEAYSHLPDRIKHLPRGVVCTIV